MKVRSTKEPSNAFAVVPRPKRPGYAQVWFYENTEPVTEKHEDGRTFEGFEYDAYVLELPETDDLSQRVLDHYDDFMTVARLQESESFIASDEELLELLEEGNVTEAIRAAKIAEISKACNSIIVHGIDLELSEGTVHFNLAVEDQANIANLFRVVELGGTEFPYQSDGGVCRIYTAAEIAQIYIAAQTLITTQTTYHNALKAYVLAQKDVQKIVAATYGMKLPKKYSDEMEAKLGVAQTQMEAIVAKLGG